MSLDWLLLGLRLLGTLILYAFLGVAFYLIWRELKQAADQITEPLITAQLRVIETDDHSFFSVGQTIPLRPVTLLGRNPDNQIVVSYETIPQPYARLRQTTEGWRLENETAHVDNGITLNQTALTQPMPVTDGDLINIETICFRLETK